MVGGVQTQMLSQAKLISAVFPAEFEAYNVHKFELFNIYKTP
jgi:hypothetical protein